MLYEKLDDKSSVDKANYGTYFSRKRTPEIGHKKRSLKHLFLVFALFAISTYLLLRISTSFINFYGTYNYEELFENVKLSSKYDTQNIDLLVPVVDLKLTDKNIKLEHKVISFINSKNSDYKSYSAPGLYGFLKSFLFYFHSNYVLKYESEENSFLKISQKDNLTKEKFKFSITKTSSKFINSQDKIKCYNVSVSYGRDKLAQSGEIETCFNLNENSWFGGHESYEQPFWPINKQVFDYVPYVTGYADEWSAVMERYWISSNGVAIFVEDDVPLLVKHKNPNQICLKSSTESHPYRYTPVFQKGNTLEYKLCTAENIKSLQMHMIENYLGKPATKPDLLMMKLPVFTTWNYFFRDINQSIVMDYANQIKSNNYSISQLEIDDKWEISYGDLDFDRTKFPEINEMISTLHSMGMRVTLWVHPFCNIDSYNFVNGTQNGYWVKDASGVHPGFTTWWNGKDTVLLDTTNPDAVDYYTKKLNYLKQTYNIDSFKFDAGETAWVSPQFKLFNNQSKPDQYAQNYVKLAAEQSDFVEVRVAHRTQNIGIFYRILDRASDWTVHDGLKSVITETLQFGILGYPFVLPDIIGGNFDPDRNNKELFIRWTQLTAFLPAMQFGVPPWFFDEETNKICKTFVDLHVSFVYPYISAMPIDGSPIIRPVWWVDPLDAKTFNISDQFMVGDDILVAPVLDPGVKSRSVYFPTGKWYDLENKRRIEGPTIMEVPVNIETIPFYVLEQSLSKFNLDS